MTNMFEAIVIFPGAIPPATTLTEAASRPAMFDATAVRCAPEMIERYLDDPSQPLGEDERSDLAGVHVGLRLIGHATDPHQQLQHFMKLVAALFETGARGVVLPAALRIVGASQHARSLLEPTEVERRLALLVHHHTVVDGERVWLHTHGMQHFGLPDIECVEPLHLAGEANRVIRAVLHRLVVGPPLGLGDVIEHDGASRFRLVPASPVEGHAFGVRDAVRLHRVA
jgi:hypothetical protein